MTGRQMREALREGRRVYGAAILNTSAWAAARYTELDLAFIDNEHCPMGRESMMALCQIFSARQIVPLVRIPVADPYLASQALDAGAEGIICPYVEDPKVAREMVGAIKYRPLKGEKLEQLLRNGDDVQYRDTHVLGPASLEYLRKKNENNLLICNVESEPSMRRLDDLLAVEGVDAVLIGPHDLSISLGMPEEYSNPNLMKAIEEIIQRTRAAGKGAGLHHYGDINRERHYIQRGANLIVHSADILEAAAAINGALSQLRAEFEDGRLPDIKKGAVAKTSVGTSNAPETCPI